MGDLILRKLQHQAKDARNDYKSYVSQFFHSYWVGQKSNSLPKTLGRSEFEKIRQLRRKVELFEQLYKQARVRHYA